jgi:hypothetical protein
METDRQVGGLDEVAEALRQEQVDELWRLARAPVKAVAKAARRALYVLKLRGVEVGGGPLALVREPLAPVSPEHVAGTADREPCLVTPIDGFGDRALWIPIKRKLGFFVSQSVLSDVGGVRACEGTEMSRRQLRQFFAGLREGEGVAPVEVPRSRALALLAEAVALAPEAQGARAATRLIADAHEPTQGLAAPSSAAADRGPDEPARLAEASELFAEPELRSYVPPEEALRALGARLDEISVSSLVVDERQRAEQRRHAVDRLVEATFTPEVRARYSRRLFELADYFAATDRPPAAARAAATARHLGGSAPILTNPFARELFSRLIREPAPAHDASAQSPPVEPRLILPAG